MSARARDHARAAAAIALVAIDTLGLGVAALARWIAGSLARPSRT